MQALRHCRDGLAAIVGCTLLSACTSLLPESKNEIVSSWASYDDAVRSLATIAPYTAKRGDVRNMGLDPGRNPTITVLHFADVLQRFAAAAQIKPEEVDRGISDCLRAGKQCSAYAISVKKLERTSESAISGSIRSTSNARR
jgi:hypothetical protein